MDKEKTYTFNTDTIVYESIDSKSEKKYYVTGYISTKDRDLSNDVVTSSAMSDMLSEILSGNVKLDYEHEAWRKENPSIIPLGKIIEAKSDDRGIFIKAQLNHSHSRFKEVWSSIKDGFLDAFSIAYKATSYSHKVIDGVKTRILSGVKLLNVALTGNPINPECRMFDVFTKSLDDFNKMEENKMAEEEAVPKEQPVVEEVEQKDFIEKKDFEDLKATSEKEIQDLKAEIKSLKELLEKPVLKAEQKSMDEVIDKLKSKVLNPLDMI